MNRLWLAVVVASGLSEFELASIARRLKR